MSFSFSIAESEIESTVGTALDEKIAALPEGPGKEEAQACHQAITEALKALTGDDNFVSASIGGHASDTTAQLTIYITKTPAS